MDNDRKMIDGNELESEYGGSGDPELERHYKGPRGAVSSVSFHPDGRKLASSSHDRCITIWNFETTARCVRFQGHTDAVMDVAFSPNGKLMASCSRDRTVRLWVPSVKGETGEFRAHSQTVRSVDFSPCGQKILSSSDDKTIKVWTVSRKKFLQSYVDHKNWVRCAKFSSDGLMVASCSDDKTAKLWDAKTSKCIHTYQEYKGQGVHLNWHPSNNYLAVGLSNGSIKLYDIRNHKLLQHYRVHDDPITQISFHASGDYLITASQDRTLKILDLLEGHPIYTLMGHSGAVTAIEFSKDGRYFASGGADKQIMVWKTNFVDAIQREECKENFDRKYSKSPSAKEEINNFNVSRVLDARKSTVFLQNSDNEDEFEENYTSKNESESQLWRSKTDKSVMCNYEEYQYNTTDDNIDEHVPRNPLKLYDYMKNYSPIVSSSLADKRNKVQIVDFPIYESIVCHLNSVHIVLHALDKRLSLLEDHRFDVS